MEKFWPYTGATVTEAFVARVRQHGAYLADEVDAALTAKAAAFDSCNRARRATEEEVERLKEDRKEDTRRIETLLSQLAEVRRAYDELIFAVASRFPDETRHETALRYIREAENRCSGPHQAREEGA